MINWKNTQEAYPEMSSWVEEKYGKQPEEINVEDYQKFWQEYDKSRQES